MCFSNLPIEFDDEGNPYLAAEAEDVDRASASVGGRLTAAGDMPLEETDAEALYAEIVAAMPESAREHLDTPTERDGAAETAGKAGGDAAEGD